MLDYLLARRATVADLQEATGRLSPRVVRWFQARLTEVQARRVLASLRGLSYEQIAQQEPANPNTGKPVLKQAIAHTLEQAWAKLERENHMGDLQRLLRAIAASQQPHEGEEIR